MTQRTRHMYVDGQWTEANAGGWREIIDPATEAIIAQVPEGDETDADRAIEMARRSFESGEWRRTPGRERSQAVYEIGDAIEADREHLAELESLDTGKTVTESLEDMDDIAACFRYFASAAATLRGAVHEPPSGALSMAVHEPVGVCSLITPWNYPLLQTAWKVAPALAAGNAAVLKPSEITPLTAIRLAELIDDVGVPSGVFNVVLGPGNPVGETMVTHEEVDMVSFTGGEVTGRRIMSRAARSIKKVALELGGKNPNIVFADAEFDTALDFALNAAYFHAGQVCSAGSRLLVDDDLHDKFVDALVDRVNQIRLGNGFDEDTQMGPVISAEHRAKVEGYLELAVKEGADIVCGGKRPDGEEFQNGFWLEPTVITGVTPEMRVAREEIFGPVITVEKFSGEDDAVRMANGTPYGLAGGVWTQDFPKGYRVARELRIGTVWINDFHPYYPEAPWGGFKRSGVGRELSHVGLEEYTELKNVHANLDPQPLDWFKG